MGLANEIEFTDLRKKLLESEKKYQKERNRAQKYLDIAGVIILELNSEGDITLINKKGCEVLGVLENEIIGENWFSTFIQKDESQKVFEIFQKSMEGEMEPIEYYENSIITNKGEKRIIAWNNSIIHENGKIIGTISSGKDITEKLEAEQKLRESEELFRLIADHSMLSISIFQDGEFKYFNQASLKINGYSEEEVLNWEPGKFIEIIHPDDVQEVIKRLSVLNLGGKIRDPEYTLRLIRKSGEIRWVRSYFNEIPYKGKKAFLVSIIDITEEKIANEKLKKSEELFRMLSENSVDTIWTRDLERNFNYLSPSVERLLGYTPEEMLNLPREMYLTPESIVKENQVIIAEYALDNEGSVDVNRTVTLELEEIHKEGSIIDVETNMKFLRDSNGKSIGVIGISRDITARKKVEKELREKTEDLIRSNKDLQQFAHVASHDLRDPLQSVSGYMHLLDIKHNNKLDEKGQKYLHSSLQGLKRMDNLITDILLLSRAGSHEINYKSVNLNELIDGVLVNLRKSIKESDTQITQDNLPQITADPLQISQLFQNLIGNAIKFVKNTIPEIHIGVQEKKDEWVFFVKDNGIGIDPKNFEKIFIIFKRLHSQKDFEGTGIGLSICKKIVERHNGKIWVESTPGKGSTFFFTIRVKHE